MPFQNYSYQQAQNGREEVTPKRNYTAYNQRRRPTVPSNLVSIRSPIGSRVRPASVHFAPPVLAKPRTPSFQRQLNYLRQSTLRRDRQEGWIDEQAEQKKEEGYYPVAPKKNNIQVTPRATTSSNVSRRLFAPPDAQSTVNVSKIAFLRESLRLKEAENDNLRRELVRVKKQANSSNSLDLERVKRECVQLRQENERLKAAQTTSHQTNDLISEIKRRDEYIRATDEHHASVLTTLKAKLSTQLSGKNQMISNLEQKVKSVEEEKIRLEARVDAMLSRHSKEADQMIGKLRALMEERNRLVLSNAEQSRTIEALERDQENSAFNSNRLVKEEKPFRMGSMKDSLPNLRPYERRF